MQPPRISHGRIVLDLQNFKGGPSLLLGEIPIVIGEAGGHEHHVWMRGLSYWCMFAFGPVGNSTQGAFREAAIIDVPHLYGMPSETCLPGLHAYPRLDDTA